MTIARFILAIALMLFAAALPARATEPAGSGEPAWLGAQVETVTPQLMAKHKLLLPFGALVTGVVADSPALKADIRIGDVIISIGAKPVVTADMLMAALKELTPGAEVTIARARITTKTVTVTLAAKPKPKPAKPKAPLSPPLLMLDTGGHMALIKDVVFTPDGRLLVSAGNDKVIRIWDWRQGKTIRTIRGQSGPGPEGKIFAMALSPNGTILAAGGWTHSQCAGRCGTIRLYDFTSGKLLSLLRGHGNVVNALAFSPDGRRLISGSGDLTAILWNVASPGKPKLLHRLKGHTNDIYAVAFTPDNRRAVTGSFDHNLRLWRVSDGELLTTMSGKKDEIYTLAVNPKTGNIASGHASGSIRLWDGKTGRPLPAPARDRSKEKERTSNLFGRTKAGVGALVFSPDGTSLLSTCGGWKESCSTQPEIVWNSATGKQQTAYRRHNNVVVAATISPDGKWAATGGGDDQEIHVWALSDGRRYKNASGKVVVLKGSGNSIWAAGFSNNGHAIAWGRKWTRNNSSHGYGPLQYTLPLPLASAVLGKPISLSKAQNTPLHTRILPPALPRLPADTQDPQWEGDYGVGVAKHGKWSLAHRPGGDYGDKHATLDILRKGKLLTSITRDAYNGYGHSAYSFTPDVKTVISGGSGGVLQAYKLWGKKSGNFIGHQGDIWAVTPSPDGRFLVSGSADQTVKLWNLKTRELIVTLFHGNDGEWVLWTPQGYFTGSPGGAKLVGWQINKGPAKAATYVTGQQLRKRLYRPDIITRAIQLASAKAALKEAGLGKVSVTEILTKLPPEIRAAADAQASGGFATIGLQFGKNDLPVTSVSFFVSNGKTETKVKAEPQPLPDEAAALKAQGYDLRAYRVPLFAGANTIRVVATNGVGESAPAQVSVQHNGEGALDKRGTLWLLAVGVDNYPGAPGIYSNLRFAGADAKAFAATVIARMKGQHDAVKATLLVNGGKDGEPTRANIVRALEGIAKLSRSTDTVMLFFAGHGENWKGGRYHFLPTDFKRKSRDNIGRNVIDWAKTIQGTITAARGRRLVFVDACRAGTAHFNAKLLGDALADRFVAFAASAANQDAYEFASEGHGAFTATLLAGFKGKARDPARRAVTVYRLGTYVNEAVSARTQGRQTPEYQSGQGNFILAR